MGSFAAFVSLPEHLRPWAQAGLSHLFLPGGLPVLQAPSPAPEQAASAAQTPPSAAPVAAPVWPAPWSIVASRVRTAPRVIITYEELAQDLAGQADAARRKLFQNVLGFLGWPQGTCLFWPLFHASGAAPDGIFATDVFAAGVEHYAVRHLICFGSKAQKRAATLFPQEDAQPRVRIHPAPAPAELLGLLPHELHRALARLKDIQLP